MSREATNSAGEGESFVAGESRGGREATGGVLPEGSGSHGHHASVSLQPSASSFAGPPGGTCPFSGPVGGLQVSEAWSQSDITHRPGCLQWAFLDENSTWN